MTLTRSPVRSHTRSLTRGLTELVGGGSSFSPTSLFALGEAGGAYIVDPAYLWQDTAGTTAVTAVGQTVRRIDDQSGNGNHATNAGSEFTLRQDPFGNYYLENAGGALMATGTVFSSMTAWPSIAAAYYSDASTAAYPFSVGIIGQDRHLTLQQGTDGNDRAGIWKRSNGASQLQTISGGWYMGHVVGIASVNGTSNTLRMNGQNQDTTGGSSAPTSGNYAIAIGGQNDASPNTGACHFYGGMAIDRQLTADEITSLNSYYDSICPVGNLKSARVYALLGQSNMIGRDTGDSTEHADNVMQFTSSEAGIAPTKPLEHVNPQSGDMGLDVTFTIEHAAGIGGDVVLIPSAQGGTGFTNNFWNQGDALYNDAVEQANFFHTLYQNSIDAILWHQGESDDNNATYETDLDTFIGNLRTDLSGASSSTPMLLGGMVPEWVSGDTSREAIQAIIEDTPNRISNTYYVSSAGLSGVSGDEIHFDLASTKTLGERYYYVASKQS